MAKKHHKKVRRIEIEKVKSGDGKRLHKVTVHYHHSPGREGKGLHASIGQYHEPEDTFHTTHAKAKKHVHELMGQMTATPEEEPIQEDQGGVSAAGAARNDAADVGVAD